MILIPEHQTPTIRILKTVLSEKRLVLFCLTSSKEVKAHLAEHCMDDLLANRDAVSPTLNPTVSNNASDNSPLIWTKEQA